MVSSDINTVHERPRQSARDVSGRTRKGIKSLPTPVVLYLLTVFLPLNFNIGPLAMNGLRVLLLVLIIPLTINLISGKYGRILWTDVLFFLHMLWAAVALSVNNPSLVVQNIGSTSIEFIGGYVLARAYIRTIDDATALTRGLIIMVICSLPFAFYEAQTGRPILLNTLNKLPGFYSLPDVSSEKRWGLFRTQTMFAHPIHYGIFCTLALSLTYVGLKGILKTSSRLLFTVLIMLGIFFSLSSGAQIAAVLQIGLIFWAWLFRKVGARWLILAGLAIAGYILVDLLSNRTPMQVFTSYLTFSPDNASWRAITYDWGMRNVWGSPIFGIGLNDWVRPDWMGPASIDNFWLLMAMRYGFPGIILLLLGFMLPIVRIAFRNFGTEGNLWQYRRAWVITLAGLAFSLTTVAVWATAYSFVFFLFGSGMWMITAKSEHVPASGPRGRRSTKRSDDADRQDTNAEAWEAGEDSAAHEAQRYTRFPLKEPGSTKRPAWNRHKGPMNQ